MNQPQPTCRRDLLRVGGLTLLSAPVVAACGSSGASLTPTAAPDGTIRVPTSQVPVGQSVYDPTHKLIVSHPTQGDVIVFDSTCPHQGCAVSTVEDGQLVCPCHGSTFDASNGEVLQGPATTGLTVRASSVKDEEIVISG